MLVFSSQGLVPCGVIWCMQWACSWLCPTESYNLDGRPCGGYDTFAGPQCDSCSRLTKSSEGKALIRLHEDIHNDEEIRVYLGNDVNDYEGSGSGKFFCGTWISGHKKSTVCCGPRSIPSGTPQKQFEQCNSCKRLTDACLRSAARKSNVEDITPPCLFMPRT